MSRDPVSRAAIEMALAIAAWVFAATWLLDRAGASSALGWVIVIAGGVAVGASVGWLRIARADPEALPSGADGRPNGTRVGLVLGLGGSTLMAVLLLVQDDDTAHVWGVVFAVS